MMSSRGGSSSPSEGLRWAEKYIEDNWGDTVSVDQKLKPLLKFGRNQDVGNTASTRYTIMTLPAGQNAETYIYTNSITHISSSNTNDDQLLTIEGHTVSNGEYTFVSQTKALTGQTKAELDTPLARVTRIANSTTTNDDNILGSVYVFEDDTLSGGVPTTATKIHLMTPVGEQQSLKASTTISKDDYWIVTGVSASILEKASAFAEVRMEVRNLPGVFRPVVTFDASRPIPTIDPPIVVRKNSDVRLTAVASGTSIDVSGYIQGYLAKVVL